MKSMFMNAILFVKSQLLAALRFMRLADDDGMDLTNLSLYVVLAGMIFSFLPTGVDVAVLLITLLARAHKKQIHAKTEVKATQVVATIAKELQDVRAKAQESAQELNELKTRYGLETFTNPFGR